MRTIATWVFVAAFFVAGVLGGSLYGEKEDALAAVQKKFKELQEYSVIVYRHVENERQKSEPAAEEDALKETETQKETCLRELSTEVTATSKTAIARGKPLATIDCIIKGAIEGHDAIVILNENFKKSVEGIKKTKEEALKLAEFEINLIGTAMKGLKEESENNINEAKTGFQALKTDALKKLDSAKKQLEEVEKRVPKPLLFDEYSKVKKDIEIKNKDLKESAIKKVQKCL